MPFNSCLLHQSLQLCGKKTGKICFMKGNNLAICACFSKIMREYFRAGSSVMAAYVEIVFDNSDGKFQILCLYDLI